MISVHMRKKCIDLFSKSSYFFCKFHVEFSTHTQKQSLETQKAVECLLRKHNFSPKTVSKVASALTKLKKPGNPEEVISFLKEFGFSKSQLERLVKSRPQLLSSKLESTIKPKFKILQGLEFSGNELPELIANDPWILNRSKDIIVRSISVLKGLVTSDDEVVNLLRASCWFLARDLNKTVVPNVEFLKSCGIPLQEILRLTYHFPRFLLSEPEIIRRSVAKANEMGVRISSSVFIYAVRVLSSMSSETWEMKLQSFRDMGFSEEDILRAFRQSPLVLSVSTKKMMKVKEVVLATGKYDMSCIIHIPVSLCYSIENWYGRRLPVLRVLETKNLITEWPTFTTLCRLPEREFCRRYVAPYEDQVGEVYGKINVV